ncbi:hypothetical protein BDN72DRAFT_872993 [Pluteus cervinus]|uniref:Uncharacterized protein n=1 Tax=Pluteus cervinus TaxID=181527 RepID=A0ACD3A2J4_9AGAR|nr:hypothetical protein BDN72DRAFT_872993 [Pluteus cervinus]
MGNQDANEGENLPRVFKVEFPNQSAGAPIDPPFGNMDETETPNENPWAPFNSRMEWEIARWAKLRGLGSTAFSDLLSIPGVKESLGLSYGNTRELNAILDDHLTSRCPPFQRREVIVQNEVCELYFRDIIGCIRSIWADEELAGHLVFKPVQEYTDEDHKNRLYNEMNTAKWWWATQVALDSNEEGGTIVPVLISSDKTTLTMFGGKQAYPIYMTIGNVPKEIRRKPRHHAQILVGYLPIASLEHVPVTARRRTLTNLFHYCVDIILAPLKQAGEVGVSMRSGDGVWRRCHPIFATFVGDYPEQLLVTCIKQGQCPTMCVAKPHNIGGSLQHAKYRDIDTISTALNSLPLGATSFRRACADAGVKPVQNPFWLHLPYLDIYHSITPDILHQLYQGLIKHLIEWLREAYGDAEIDARCRRLPPNHQVRQFFKGITRMTRVTGKEHSQISRIILGILIDAKPHHHHTTAQSKRLVHAVRGLLDFVFIAQFPTHTSATLRDLKTALNDFHAYKNVFIQLNIRIDFNIPKLHSLEHYSDLIQFYGTTDNYNTEYTERLHIDFAKEAFRSTNMRDEFPQMTLWLDRREKVIEHEQVIRSRQSSLRPPPNPYHSNSIRISLDTLVEKYKAIHFANALAQFIVSRREPTYSWHQIEQHARDLQLPDVSFSVYHSIKFVIDTDLKSETIDIIHAKPSRSDKRGRPIPPRFDTALLTQSDNPFRAKDYQVVRVRTIFKLPIAICSEFLSEDPDFGIKDVDSSQSSSASSTSDTSEPNSPIHLAYVELFTKFGTPDDVHGMYSIKPLIKDQLHVYRIIPVSYLCRSVHLFPRFGQRAESSWTSSNVLDKATQFFVNTMSDRDMFR